MKRRRDATSLQKQKRETEQSVSLFAVRTRFELVAFESHLSTLKALIFSLTMLLKTTSLARFWRIFTIYNILLIKELAT